MAARCPKLGGNRPCGYLRSTGLDQSDLHATVGAGACPSGGLQVHAAAVAVRATPDAANDPGAASLTARASTSTAMEPKLPSGTRTVARTTRDGDRRAAGPG